MAYSPSPSAPHSPHHLAGYRSAASAIVEQEKYLSELLSERNKLGPFVPVLPLCYRLLNQGKLVKLALLEFMASYAVPRPFLPLQTHYSISL